MILEPKQYSKVTKLRPSEGALRNATARLEKMFTNKDNSPNKIEKCANCGAAKKIEKVVSNIAVDLNTEEARETTNNLDTIVFLMFEVLPSMEDCEIRGYVVKALKLCEEMAVVASFENDQYFVKS